MTCVFVFRRPDDSGLSVARCRWYTQQVVVMLIPSQPTSSHGAARLHSSGTGTGGSKHGSAMGGGVHYMRSLRAYMRHRTIDPLVAEAVLYRTARTWSFVPSSAQPVFSTRDSSHAGARAPPRTRPSRLVPPQHVRAVGTAASMKPALHQCTQRRNVAATFRRGLQRRSMYDHSAAVVVHVATAAAVSVSVELSNISNEMGNPFVLMSVTGIPDTAVVRLADGTRFGLVDAVGKPQR